MVKKSFPKTTQEICVVIGTIIYIITISLRTFNLSMAPLYPDEITWMVRGKELIYSLIHFNFSYLNSAWWTSTTQVEAIGIPLSLVSGFSHIIFAGQGVFSLHLFSDVVASRLPQVIVASFLPPLIFYFTYQFSKNILASLISSILYAFNPIVIGLDRWILHDSFLTFFSFASIAFFLISLQNKKNSVLPGLFLSLAFLTKPNGILVIIAWLVAVYTYKLTKFSKKLLFTNIISAFFLTTFLFPSSWDSPLSPFIAPIEYLIRQKQLVSAGVVTSFYMGKPSLNPHWSYYFFQIFSRLSEITILGALLSVFYFLKNKKNRLNPFILPVVVYTFIFFFLISTADQKLGIRYTLPVVPWISIMAGVSLEKISHKILKNLGKAVYFFSIIALITLPVISYQPLYYLYYNHLIGGPKNAIKYDLVSLCYGAQPALRYINQHRFSPPIYIAGCQDIAPYYTDKQLTKDLELSQTIIVETAYLQQFPNSEIREQIKNFKKAVSFNYKGAPVATIYTKKTIKTQKDKTVMLSF